MLCWRTKSSPGATACSNYVSLSRVGTEVGSKLGDDPLKRHPLFLLDLFELLEDSGLEVDEGFGHTW